MIYDKVGPTAWNVACLRAFAGIKYSKEIFDELAPQISSAKQKQRNYFEKASMSKPVRVQIEARYKLINKILEKQKLNQVFEIAAGLSPRGLSMAEENPNLTYVELDLPEMAKEKKKILNKIKAKLNMHVPNLKIRSGDALKYESLFAATKYFKRENIAVINEGLLRYLNFEQKAQVSQNVNQLLKYFGGVWITPDITLRRVILGEKGAERQRIKKLTGMDIFENSFESIEHAKEFFMQQGFHVEHHSYMEVENELVSPKKLEMPKKEVRKVIKNLCGVFLMKIA